MVTLVVTLVVTLAVTLVVAPEAVGRSENSGAPRTVTLKFSE